MIVIIHPRSIDGRKIPFSFISAFWLLNGIIVQSTTVRLVKNKAQTVPLRRYWNLSNLSGFLPKQSVVVGDEEIPLRGEKICGGKYVIE